MLTTSREMMKKAYEDGCKKAVVILTQDKQFVKKPIKDNFVIRRALKKYPLLAQALLHRHEMYNEQRKFVEAEELAGNIMVICPPKPLNCSSIEKDLNKLEVIYQMGYQQGLKYMDEIKKFISE